MDLEGRVFVVTGATSGIGRAAALALARRGATLALLGRDADRLVGVEDQARDAGARVWAYRSDFTRLAEVRRAAEKILDDHPRVDVLLNNAGGHWRRRHLTEDGHERTFQVNVLAPFLLTRLLQERLDRPGGKVVTVASEMQRRGRLDLERITTRPRYSGLQAYADSKLADIAWTLALAQRLEHATANAVHPGVVRTGIHRDVPTWARPLLVLALGVGVTAQQGADTPVWLCTTDVGTGGYYARRRPLAPKAEAQDEGVQDALWRMCVGLSTGGGTEAVPRDAVPGGSSRR